MTLDHLATVPRSLLAFAVVLGVLIFIHEMGHYLAARAVGVTVEAFSIGFGRAIAKWTDRAGCQWQIGWIPLGGFVRMRGAEQPDRALAALPAAERAGRFDCKPVAARAFVIAAGPVANFLLSVVLFFGLYLAIGIPTALPVIGDVLPDSAAAAAGLRAGDEIVSIDAVPMRSFDEVARYVRARPNATLPFHLNRDKAETDLPVRIFPSPTDENLGQLGIRSGELSEMRPAGLGGAFVASLNQTYRFGADTLAGLKRIVTGQGGASELGGPLKIAELSGKMAERGAASLLSFIAILSVNLGLFNLIPIPVLDGGHLMFYAIEAVIGRPVPKRAIELGLGAGFAVLVSLIVFITVNDLGSFGLWSWMRGLRG